MKEITYTFVIILCVFLVNEMISYESNKYVYNILKYIYPVYSLGNDITLLQISKFDIQKMFKNIFLTTEDNKISSLNNES